MLDEVQNSRVLLRLLPATRWCLAWLILWLWRWRRHVPPKRRLISTDYTALYSEDITLHNHRCESLKSKMRISINVSRHHQKALTLVYPENVCGFPQSQQATAEIGPSKNPRLLHVISLPTHHSWLSFQLIGCRLTSGVKTPSLKNPKYQYTFIDRLCTSGIKF
jgi:hypothetical protein